jgi:hypothetical protein
MNLYYSLIYPHLLYAIQVWGHTFKENIEKLSVLQKKTVRMMTFNLTFFSKEGPPVHSSPLFKKLGILKLYDIIELRLTQFIFDSIHKTAPSQFHDWFLFTGNMHSHSTRSDVCNKRNIDDLDEAGEIGSAGNLFIPFARTKHYGLRSIKVSGPKIWNNLPSHIRESESRIIFGKRFKKNKILDY